MTGAKRDVKIGRVCLVNYGPMNGKLVVVNDILDQNRGLMTAPGMEKQVINFKSVVPTAIEVKLPRGCRNKIVKKVWAAEKVEEQWNNSAWAKKINQREVRANLTDFERFKASCLRAKRANLINREIAALKKN
eukprot:TRINITY_DN45_c0_g1_i1.p2 TRINITY_DN45_c0_g1~~TRINITY_DN45_c0_g1_i1.p2  ORF type:complete len:146 (-),score=56.58 TRINITY_DN45_c0_g1_i1:128-526(-)